MAEEIVADQITANQIMSQKVGGLPGTEGTVLTASQIILNGWIIQAQGDGIYVTTPGGIQTKMELIDFRQTPVPPTAPLNLQASQASVGDIAVGAGSPGASPVGFFVGGGGYGGSPTTATSAQVPVTPVGNLLANNSTVASTPASEGAFGPSNNPGTGTGYQPISSAGTTTLSNKGITDPAFITGLNTLAQELNVPADNMVIVFQIESSLNPAAQNSSTNATGLNQIMPRTANALGYTIPQIHAMTATQQITGPTKAYFESNKRLLPQAPSLADLYLINFFPAACGKADNFICGTPQYDGTINNGYPARASVAKANPAFAGPDGLVTVGSVKNWIATKWKTS